MLKVNHSIEALLNVVFALVTLSIGVLTYILLYKSNSSPVGITFILLQIVIAGLFSRHFVSKRIVYSIQRLSTQVEAIKLEDYNIEAKSYFSRGCIPLLHNELTTLGKDLQARKERYDQNVHIIYNLIENIATPVLIVNQMEQLIHANKAFELLFSRPWETCRYWKLEHLGLFEKDGKWQFKENRFSHRWQINRSELRDRNSVYQMLFLTDILSTTRQVQQQSWSNITRVLSHEIRNSLSPIISLSQTLHELKDMPEKAKWATQVIAERARHLNEFSHNYSQIHRPLAINKKKFLFSQITEKLTTLFTDIHFKFSGQSGELYADPVSMEQVLINLVKNASEACSENPEIDMQFSQTVYEQEIRIIDNGQGIANVDNLFVPFYSTKRDGQGIGLALSKHIVEEHQGQLMLTNRDDKQGAQATIIIPADPSRSEVTKPDVE